MMIWKEEQVDLHVLLQEGLYATASHICFTVSLAKLIFQAAFCWSHLLSFHICLNTALFHDKSLRTWQLA